MEEALALRAAARKKTNSVAAFLGKLSKSKSKAAESEEAQELYTQAANLFLRERDFVQAADSFISAAKASPSVYTQAALRVEAAQAWRSGNEPQYAAKCYADAISIFARHGPLRRAALVCVDLAKLFEEQNQLDSALKTWLRAAEVYDEQHDTPHAAQARLGAADVAARVNQLPLAITNYEQAAEACAQETLTKFKLKQYFLKSGLCYLAEGDVIGLDKALAEKYTRWDRAFSSTLEYRLLVELRNALQERNIHKFERAMYTYDTKHRLDKWQLEISLKIKQRFNQLPEEELL